MFLSDKLQSIYEESQQFDLETCNKIIKAIKEKALEDVDRIADMAKQRGSIKSGVIHSAFDNIENVFERFAAQHSDIPDILCERVSENISSYRDLLRDAEERNR